MTLPSALIIVLVSSHLEYSYAAVEGNLDLFPATAGPKQFGPRGLVRISTSLPPFL